MEKVLHIEEQTSRFKQLLDTTKPENQPKIAIVGLGSVGSHLAPLLARMGFHRITLYDFDEVEEVNLGYQNYRLEDMGKKKTEALAEIIKEQTGVEVETVDGKIEDGSAINTDILIMGADDMEVRKELAEKANYINAIDAQMGAEEITVYQWGVVDLDRYLERWFPSSEAQQAPCGGKAIGYTCLLVAGMVGNVVKRIVNREKTPFEQGLLISAPTLDVEF